MVSGAKVSIIGSSDVSFGVAYDDGFVSKVRGKYASIHNCVGRKVILKALWLLKHGSMNEKAFAFHTICKNICEATRFSAVGDLVSLAIRTGEDKPLGTLSKLFQNWNRLSTFHRNKSLEAKDQNYFCEALKKMQIVGISSFNELEQALSLMLKEKDSEREGRRLELIKKSKHAKKYYNKNLSLLGKYKKKKRKWNSDNNVSLSDLRENELQRLISSGGNPEIWRCLHEAMMEDHERYARYKLINTDISLVDPNKPEFVDDRDNFYKFEENYMICDPIT